MQSNTGAFADELTRMNACLAAGRWSLGIRTMSGSLVAGNRARQQLHDFAGNARLARSDLPPRLDMGPELMHRASIVALPCPTAPCILPKSSMVPCRPAGSRPPPRTHATFIREPFAPYRHRDTDRLAGRERMCHVSLHAAPDERLQLPAAPDREVS